ncbi:hypothetical protein BC833DRAFT_328221 [Globomyces pollinis-pini]|nr:hypothetical protein BC833DRAFT_328221 [Globomyces pollinis-pini]
MGNMEVNQFISTSIPEHLNELVLMNVTFTEQGLLGLRDTLKVLPLSSLGISSPHISRNMIDVLSPGLINSTMESFFLKSDDIPNKAIRLLSTKLRQHPYLVHLSLAQSIVDDEGVRALKFLIDEKSTLEELDLDSNTITDDGFSFLLEGLKNNEFLVSISIANNDISDDGIISLVQFLHTNTTLLSLNLNNNKITDVGITLLAKALEQNPSLRQIRLTNNSISNFGAEVLCSFLKKNRTLMELYIAEGNDINEDGIKGCLEQLKYNGFLEKTDLHPDVTLVDNVEFNEKRNEKASTFFQSVPPLIKLIPQIGKPAVELTAQYLLLDKSNDIEYFNESERLTLIHGCINEENYQYIKAELHDVTAWSLLTRCQKLLRDVAKIEGQDEVSDQEYEIEDILNSRISKNKRKLEYLIKWDGYPIEDATWQNYEFLENSQMLIDEVSYWLMVNFVFSFMRRILINLIQECWSKLKKRPIVNPWQFWIVMLPVIKTIVSFWFTGKVKLKKKQLGNWQRMYQMEPS